jgi:hypothetical protein
MMIKSAEEDAVDERGQLIVSRKRAEDQFAFLSITFLFVKRILQLILTNVNRIVC